MKCTILHECPGRLRIHAAAPAMSLRQADILEAYLKKTSGVECVNFYDRTWDAVIRYTGSREPVIRALSAALRKKRRLIQRDDIALSPLLAGLHHGGKFQHIHISVV